MENLQSDSSTDLNPAALADEAQVALTDVTNAALATEELLLREDAALGIAPATSGERVQGVTEADVNLLRKRALQQRQRGQKNLARRHDGIASVIQKVTINERVVGSAFERFFPVIENGIHVIVRRGDMFFTARNMGTVVDSLTKMTDELEADLKKELSALEEQLARAKANAPELFVTPEYTAPSAQHEPQVRTRLAVRILNLFQNKDKLISGLQTLMWNGEVEQAAIDEQELRLKREVRDLAKFIGRTLRSMRNKVAAADQTGAPEQAGSSEPLAEAA